VIAVVVAAAGIALDAPAGWHALKLPDMRPVVDPTVPLVVSSDPIRRNGRPCEVGQFAPRRTGVTIVVVEWRGHYGSTRWPPRPRRFDQGALPLRLGSIECFAGRGGSVAFTQNGRRLGVYLLAGRHAAFPLVRRARAVIASLKLLRR
jgi:hypothetical protein